MNVLVTGSSGFIGSNLCAQLDQEEDVTLLKFTHSNTPKDLKEMVTEADFIFHIAGINRPKDPSEFETGNKGLTEDIVELIKTSGKKIPIVITSSTQAELDNPYGISKKAAEQSVFDMSKSQDNKAYVYRLPNVFGKWSRANYNSVVATFCNNIATGKEISINDPSSKLNLVYIDDVVQDFIDCLKGDKRVSDDGYCYVERTFDTNLQSLADKINSFKESRDSLIVPDFADPFDRFLYATFTSYLEKSDFGYNLDMKTDDRGWLAEFVKSDHFGQVFVSRTKPGIARGNHWHHTKIEKFFVVEGDAEIKFRDIKTGDKVSYKVTGDTLQVVDIPAGYVHSITNTGERDLITLFWSDEIFNPEHPDTYYEEV